MPQGLEVYLPTGQVITYTDRMARIFGSINTAAGGGATLTDANFATGTPFAIVIPLSTTVNGVGQVSFSGNTMTVTASPMAALVIYGVY